MHLLKKLGQPHFSQLFLYAKPISPLLEPNQMLLNFWLTSWNQEKGKLCSWSQSPFVCLFSNQKSKGPEILRKYSSPPVNHVSCVTCHVASAQAHPCHGWGLAPFSLGSPHFTKGQVSLLFSFIIFLGFTHRLRYLWIQVFSYCTVCEPFPTFWFGPLVTIPSLSWLVPCESLF